MDDRFDWQALYPAGLARAWSPPEQPLWRFLADAAERTPDAVAVSYEGNDLRYADLWDHARAAGGILAHRGVRAGDRVLLVLPNCPEFVATYHGALAAGCVVVAASPHLTAAELAEVIADAEPAFVFREGSDAPGASTTEQAIARAGLAGKIDVHTAWPGRGVSCFGNARRIDPVDVDPAATAVLQYTSGTTGGLKAARMSHRNLVANALQNDLWFGWTRDDVILGALPLCHTWGMCCVMNAALAAGARVALLPRFDPGEVLATIERERVTVAYGSATMFHRLLDAAGARAPERLASLRYVKAGAMLVGGDLYARWTAAVPGVPMVNGYGLTEASPEVTNNPPHARRAGTVGIPLPGTELRLGAVPEADDGEGEVQVRGPQVMSGYWRRDDATRAAFTDDGWLRTGDLARFDAAGHLVIVDRLKDLIKHRGWSVAPGEVERALREHPAVAEACVVGAPDPRDGEVPVAFLVVRDGAALLPETDLPPFLGTRLAPFKHPRRYAVVPEIPKNHVGKPLRRVLRARLGMFTTETQRARSSTENETAGS